MLGQSFLEVVHLLHLLEAPKHRIVILKIVLLSALPERRSLRLWLMSAISIDQFLALEHLQFGLSG